MRGLLLSKEIYNRLNAIKPMHKHHVIPRSRGGKNGKIVEIPPLEHALLHAQDYLEGGPHFDFRHEAWPLLPAELKEKVMEKHREECRQRWIENNPVHQQNKEEFSARMSKIARQRVADGTCPILPQNRYWDQSALAKTTRANMTADAVFAMVRKQTVNRRINAGWTNERLNFILCQLPCSSGKVFKLCHETFGWPSSRGATQNIIRALETEGLENIFNLDLVLA